MSTIVETLDDLRPLVGTSLGSSEWVEIDQARIDTFADATDDHQWIHVDPRRAKNGPFGTTIAHGYLTLALLIPMWAEILDVTQVSAKVNYGLGKVRFPAPVPAGSKIRANATRRARRHHGQSADHHRRRHRTRRQRQARLCRAADLPLLRLSSPPMSTAATSRRPRRGRPRSAVS
jgi:acyl dehydratase